MQNSLEGESLRLAERERERGSLRRAREKAHQITLKSSQSAKETGKHATKPEPITSEEENKRIRDEWGSAESERESLGLDRDQS